MRTFKLIVLFLTTLFSLPFAVAIYFVSYTIKDRKEQGGYWYFNRKVKTVASNVWDCIRNPKELTHYDARVSEYMKGYYAFMSSKF